MLCIYIYYIYFYIYSLYIIVIYILEKKLEKLPIRPNWLLLVNPGIGNVLFFPIL